VLSIATRSPHAARVTVTLAYLSSGFDWNASYVATIGPETGTLDLSAWATLANDNAESFPGAMVNIVAGRLQRRSDREIILPGLAWIEAESQTRFSKAFAALAQAQKEAIANDICSAAKAAPQFAGAAKFFAKFRDLTAGGFYTTPVGMKDIGYVGNVPLAKFDGPPIEVLKKVGLA